MHLLILIIKKLICDGYAWGVWGVGWRGVEDEVGRWGGTKYMPLSKDTDHCRFSHKECQKKSILKFAQQVMIWCMCFRWYKMYT